MRFKCIISILAFTFLTTLTNMAFSAELPYLMDLASLELKVANTNVVDQLASALPSNILDTFVNLDVIKFAFHGSAVV